MRLVHHLLGWKEAADVPPECLGPGMQRREGENGTTTPYEPEEYDREAGQLGEVTQ